MWGLIIIALIGGEPQMIGFVRLPDARSCTAAGDAMVSALPGAPLIVRCVELKGKRA